MKQVITLLLSFIFLQCPAQSPGPGQVIINEILFNPPPGGYDYVEGYNRDNAPVDLAALNIANRNSTGDISAKKSLTGDSAVIPARGYFVVTANEKWLRQKYAVPADARVFQVSAMPSFPDDEGTVVFCLDNDSVVDEVHYHANWHLALINDPAGVALERIDPDWPSMSRNTWTSAASSAGYGTPGFENSERASPGVSSREVSMPPLFSPDNNGVDDVELMHFSLSGPGYMANTSIYDLSGRKVRQLLHNELVGREAVYQWDGSDEQSNPLPAGVYMIVTQLFSEGGEVKTFKNAVALIRR